MLPPYGPGFSWSTIFEHYATLSPDRVAVSCGTDRLTWREVNARTKQAATAFTSLGVRRGDKVALVMESSITLFELFWGVLKSGAVAVPFSTALSDETLARLICNSDAVALMADAASREQIERIRPLLTAIQDENLVGFGHSSPGWQQGDDLVAAARDAPPDVDIGPNDTMMIIYSSGTTGIPKGIEITHAARIAYPIGLGARLRFDSHSVAICSTPIYGNGTYMMLLPALYFGARTVLMPKFDAREFLDVVQCEKGTHSFMVPVQFRAVLDVADFDDFALDSLRVLVTAGQPLPNTTRQDLGVKFPDAELFEVYGFSEAFGTLNTPEDMRGGKSGSVGRSFFFDDVRVIGDRGEELPRGSRGEVVVYGPSLMKGYYKDPIRTEAAIWQSACGRKFLRSGDIGHLDEDGYLYISGRLKETIKSGGINVYASDLEEIFMQHPAVREAAAIGVPDEKWGETPLVFIILKKGVGEIPENIARWANERLSKYQRVSRVEIRDDFPRGGYGKVQKQALRALYLDADEGSPT